jgi:hypothetical protein
VFSQGRLSGGRESRNSMFLRGRKVRQAGTAAWGGDRWQDWDWLASPAHWAMMVAFFLGQWGASADSAQRRDMLTRELAAESHWRRKAKNG